MTNSNAAQKRLIETKCNSAISFIKVVGTRSKAIPIAYEPLHVPKLSSHSYQTRAFITLTAMLLNTLTNITIRKKLLTQIKKQIIKIDARPRTKYPISNIDEGLFGHTSLALRNKIAEIVV